MQRWAIPVALLVGIALGVAGTIAAPRTLGPYLPAALQGKTELVAGKVLRKLPEGDRLLVTVLTPHGAILATFTRRATEINLLVSEGDTLTLALARYEPFLTDPVIRGVRKLEPAGASGPPAPPAPAPATGTPKESPPR